MVQARDWFASRMALKGSAWMSHMKCTWGSTRQYHSNPASSGWSKKKPLNQLQQAAGWGEGAAGGGERAGQDFWQQCGSRHDVQLVADAYSRQADVPAKATAQHCVRMLCSKSTQTPGHTHRHMWR